MAGFDIDQKGHFFEKGTFFEKKVPKISPPLFNPFSKIFLSK